MSASPLPFTTWNFPPEADEPAHGYERRLIDAHGVNSVVTFNIWNGIESDAVSPQGSLSLLQRHPVPEDWLLMLGAATPREGVKVCHMGGQLFSAAQISQWNRRWCPGCIAEKAYHRNWWDIVALRKCPLHDLELVSEDQEGNKVTWTWPQFAFSRAGWNLGRHSSRRETDGFGRYALGRLGYIPAIELQVFESAALRDVIDASEIVGKFLMNPRLDEVPKPGVDDIDVGFAVVRGGGPAIAEAARRWLGENPRPHGPYPSLTASFGWITGKLFAMRDARLQKLIRRALKEARGFEVSEVSRAILPADFAIDYVPIKRLAMELGMEAGGLAEIAEELRLRNVGRGGQVARHDVQQITSFAASLVPPAETARRLGIHSDALRHLVHAGHLKVFRGLNPGTRNGARFDRRRIEALLATIKELPTNGNQDFGITFDLFRKRNKLVPGALAVEVLTGKRVITERRSDAPGFKSLMIETTHRRQRHAFGRSPDRVTVGQAQAMLNLSHVTVMVLIKKGLLGEADMRPRFTLLDREVIAEFGRTYAKVADFAPALGLHPIQLYKKLTKAGVSPLMAWNQSGQRIESVVRRQDVIRALGLERDPSIIYYSGLREFWAEFVVRVRERCPHLYMPDTLPYSGQRVWQNSSFSAVFRYDHPSGRLCVELVPSGGQRQALELDVTVGAHAEQVGAFLDRLVLAIEGVQERLRNNIRKRYHQKKGTDA